MKKTGFTMGVILGLVLWSLPVYAQNPSSDQFCGETETGLFSEEFDARADLPCEPPYGTAVGAVTDSSAIAIWNGTAQSYLVELYRDEQYLKSFETPSKIQKIQGLEAGTEYGVLIHAICSEETGIVSDRSKMVRFRTLEEGEEPPGCGAPESLRSTVDGYTAKANFYWAPGTENVSYEFFWKKVEEEDFDTLIANKSSWTLGNLEYDVPYQWAVRGVCVDGYSDMADGGVFEVKRDLHSEMNGWIDEISVLPGRGVIKVLNPQGIKINKMEVFTSTALLLKKEILSSTGDLEIKIEKEGIYVVVLYVSGKRIVQKVCVGSVG